MANRLSRAEIDKLWGAYQEHQSVHEVSKVCSVHRKTVERYRRVERWDERLADVRARAQAETDYDLTTAMADSLRLVRSYKAQLATALEGKRMTSDEVTVSDLERIVKLEAFVLGGVENRSEVIGAFAGWTDEELEEYARSGQSPRGPRRRSA